MLNPITTVVLVFQKALYNPPSGYIPDLSLWAHLRNVSLLALTALALLTFSLELFGRLEGKLAERI